MTTNISLDELFFGSSLLNNDKALEITKAAIHGFDDGELFLEYSKSESLAFDDGTLKQSSFNIDKGFGLRTVTGDRSAYAHSCDISERALLEATKTVRSIHNDANVGLTSDPLKTNRKLYSDIDPTSEMEFVTKVKLLQDIDSYIRKKDSSIVQVSASLSSVWQAVRIMRSSGLVIDDIRPLVRVNITVVASKNGRTERGSFGMGGRESYASFITEHKWKEAADEAIRQANVNLVSIDAPAGEMPVVLSNGWPGVLLHEAVGHGLEGDFNRKKTSAFSDLIGQQVAAKGITVVDDGTIDNRRGSLTIDDEGTPSQYNVLIEDGILKNYMQDRMNARLMGMSPTGNGRRQDYSHQPMPRMTNTYMLGGSHTQEEIIASVKKGIFAVNFAGGQVDITSGKFVFSASEAYLIENGKVTAPVKGATLIGNGPEVMKKISMIGNDMKLDNGVGTCGKDGQSVPVGIGQPSLLIDSITVGGTKI